MDCLTCRQLTKRFGGLVALDSIELEVASPNLVAVIGPNGAGKTTLIDIVTGLQKPDLGQCLWQGTDLTKVPSYRIARLGVSRSFQQLRLVWNVSVFENVLSSFPLYWGEALASSIRLWGMSSTENERRSQAAYLLSLVGLADCQSRLAAELSYGDQKLLSVACLIATGASLLLLDEPFAGVYGPSRVVMMKILRELRSRGKLVMFVEHDLSVVREVSEYVIALSAGSIISQGSTAVALSSAEVSEAYFG